MQPLSIDNPRPHQRRYAITAATTTVAITASYHHLKPLPAAGRRLLVFLSINSSNLRNPHFLSFSISLIRSYQTRFNNLSPGI